MTAPVSRYAVGQLWRCKGRTPDESPTLLINQIDQHPLGGEIYHVTLRDVRVRQPALPSGWIDSLPHAPVIAQTFERSDASLIGTDTPDPAYREGYAKWKAAFDAGNAGSFGGQRGHDPGDRRAAVERAAAALTAAVMLAAPASEPIRVC